MKLRLACLPVTSLILTLFMTVSLPAFGDLLRGMSPRAQAWRQVISEQEWKDLVRLKVQQLDFMKNLWTHLEMDNEKQKSVFLAGGAVRGLIQWIELELQQRSIEEVRQLPPPQLAQLILEGADKDIFLTSGRKDTLPEEYQVGWDVLDEKFLKSSRQAGGSNIEKIGINPFRIDDPFGALSEYYRGELGFRNVSEADFAPFRIAGGLDGFFAGDQGGLSGNSKTALVLRHLRFLLFFSAVQVTEGQLDTLRGAVAGDTLRVDNYWIRKALGKLQIQCQIAGVGVASVLHEVGLIRRLFRKGYNVQGLSAAQYADYFRPQPNESWMQQLETFLAFKKSINSYDEARALIEGAVTVTKHAGDLAQVFLVDDANSSKEYRGVVPEMWGKIGARYFDFDLSHHYWPEIKKNMMENGGLVGTFAAMRVGVSRAQTAKEILFILEPVLKTHSPEYLDEVAKIWIENAERFADTKPTFHQWQLMKSQAGRVSAVIEVMRAGARRSATARELDMILDPQVPGASPAEMETIKNLKVEFSHHQFSTPPKLLSRIGSFFRSMLPANARVRCEALFQ